MSDLQKNIYLIVCLFRKQHLLNNFSLMSCVNIALNTGDHMDRTALFACSVFPSTLRTMSLSSQESANSAIIKMRNQSLINLYRSCSSLSPKGGSWSCFSLIACTQNCNTFITQCIRFQSFNSLTSIYKIMWNEMIQNLK